ncbi:MAG: OadG family protein [Oscillospiraceae bacterium]|nr:OadG family protein [Oscillospiraceae bacterium]
MLNILTLAAVSTEAVPEMTKSFIAAMTITGLAVVFLGLLILVVYLTLSGKLFVRLGIGQPKPKKAPAAPAPKPVAAPKSAVPAAVAGEDEDEIAAVIAAVVAAMSTADGTAYAVRSIKPVRRVGSGRSAWAQAGMADLTAPFSIQ